MNEASSSTFAVVTQAPPSSSIVGHVDLLWSMYLPWERMPPILRIFETAVADWLVEEFFCTGNSTSHVRIISSLDDENVFLHGNCHDDVLENDLYVTSNSTNYTDFSSSVAIPEDCNRSDPILWNYPIPVANLTTVTTTFPESSLSNSSSAGNKTLTFSSWNISFPVYEWGSKDKIQERLQTIMDTRINKGELHLPWRDAQISVLGNEAAFLPWDENFPSAEPTSSPIFFLPTMPTTQPLAPLKTLSSADSATFDIKPEDVSALLKIGAFLFLAHTISLMLVHRIGKAYSKRQAERQDRVSLLGRKGVNDMLQLTRRAVEVSRNAGNDGNLQVHNPIELHHKQDSITTNASFGMTDHSSARCLQLPLFIGDTKSSRAQVEKYGDQTTSDFPAFFPAKDTDKGQITIDGSFAESTECKENEAICHYV